MNIINFLYYPFMGFIIINIKKKVFFHIFMYILLKPDHEYMGLINLVEYNIKI